jgi:hypothetical protein
LPLKQVEVEEQDKDGQYLSSVSFNGSIYTRLSKQISRPTISTVIESFCNKRD